MNAVALALFGIFSGALSVLLWPSLGPFALLFYPVCGSLGVLGLSAALALTSSGEQTELEATDDLVRQLREVLERDPDRATGSDTFTDRGERRAS